MFKVCLLLALSVACVNCLQESGTEAAPEPYNYAYDAGSHAAAEQRGPDGKVTGYYTIVDADGRQRRVDYFADEAGFHAKVQTNEVGTKSENSADVEVLASPPTEGQLVTSSVVDSGAQAQRFVSTQQTVGSPQRAVVAGAQYLQQPQYGYSGYSYNPGSYYGNNQQYGYSVAGTPAYSALYGTGNNGVYGGYQTVAPATASYNRQVVQPASYSVSNVASRYQTVAPGSAVRYQTVEVPSTSGYRATYQTVGVPSTSGYRATYQTVGVPGSVGYPTIGGPSSTAYLTSSAPVTTTTNYRYRQVGVGAPVYQSTGAVPASAGSPTGNLLGSSNYIVLKKRQSDAAQA